MKKIFIAIIVALCMFSSVNAEVVREGKTFTQVASSRSKGGPKETGFTWKDSKGTEYPIYISGTGSCYVVKVSKKTGKEYRQYLGEEVSKQICKELGVPYTAKSKESK